MRHRRPLCQERTRPRQERSQSSTRTACRQSIRHPFRMPRSGSSRLFKPRTGYCRHSASKSSVRTAAARPIRHRRPDFSATDVVQQVEQSRSETFGVMQDVGDRRHEHESLVLVDGPNGGGRDALGRRREPGGRFGDGGSPFFCDDSGAISSSAQAPGRGPSRRCRAGRIRPATIP